MGSRGRAVTVGSVDPLGAAVVSVVATLLLWSAIVAAAPLGAETVSATARRKAIAYVTNRGAVVPIDIATNRAKTAIAAGSQPYGVAITPDGATAYVTDYTGDAVYAIDTATNTAGAPIPVGNGPAGIAITPDGATAYVANFEGDSVSPIDTATNTARSPIPVGNGPSGIAITPNGAKAYVTDYLGGKVTPINLATGTAGTPINVGTQPAGITVAPDGATAYVANFNGGRGTVSVIHTATDFVGPTVTVATSPRPFDIAITPDGTTVYVVDFYTAAVTPIATATNTVGPAISLGARYFVGIAITPDGAAAYVAREARGRVHPIDLATNIVGAPIRVGGAALAVAITPDQAPIARFQVTPAPAGQSTGFDASTSIAPSSPIVSYRWAFGDGSTATTTGANVSHVYASAGDYKVALVLTDAAGTSTKDVFTGQTMSRNGSPHARRVHSVTIT